QAADWAESADAMVEQTIATDLAAMMPNDADENVSVGQLKEGNQEGVNQYIDSATGYVDTIQGAAYQSFSASQAYPLSHPADGGETRSPGFGTADGPITSGDADYLAQVDHLPQTNQLSQTGHFAESGHLAHTDNLSDTGQFDQTGHPAQTEHL